MPFDKFEYAALADAQHLSGSSDGEVSRNFERIAVGMNLMLL
jgi:hypothetical protein